MIAATAPPPSEIPNPYRELANLNLIVVLCLAAELIHNSQDILVVYDARGDVKALANGSGTSVCDARLDLGVDLLLDTELLGR